MTAVDDVIRALVIMANTALSSWQVLDGDTGLDLQDRTLLIGFDPVQGTPIATSSIDEDDGGICALLETITVSCTAAAFDGNAEFRKKRADVVAALTALRAALAADQKLGGIAYDAWLAPTAQWYQQIYPATSDGPERISVQADFSITVRVYAE
ncbi:MAG TPA: hypothetical protein VFR23_13825 [Jiangellaceae bacterium]|nr:hypothetical protein [Jiangellaceae bacterium]